MSLRRLLSRAAFACAFLVSSLAMADAPSTLAISGSLTTATGDTVDGTVTMTFELYDAATDGNQLFSETLVVSVANGGFIATLGETATIDLADFRDERVFVQVTVDGELPMTPRLPLTSVGYAGYAAHAGLVDWANISGTPAGLDDGDNDTTYSQGDGIDISGGVISADGTLQRRVSGACPAGTSIRVINTDGTVGCSTAAESCPVGSAIRQINADGTVDCTAGDISEVAVASGSGLTGGATQGVATIGVDSSVLQARVADTCGAGEAVRAIDDAGNVTCVTIPTASAFLPPGMIAPFAGSTAPSGWLIADGSAVSRTTYATLFSSIGVTYGAGNGSTTFNLPDLRGRAIVGAGAGPGLTNRTAGAAFGNESSSIAQANLPNVTLTGSTNTAGSHNHSASTGNAGSHAHSGSIGSGGTHNHDFYTAHHDRNDSASQGYPAGNNHNAFRTTDRRQRTEDRGTIRNTSTAHTHSLSINSAGTHSHPVSVGSSGNHSHTTSVSLGGSGVPVGLVQPSLAINYIIKH